MAEDDEALLVAGKLQVRYSEYEGNKLLDVRKYYKDKTTQELKPTRKGISLNRLQFEAITSAFHSKTDEIEEWFCSDESDKANELDAVLENRYASNDVTVKFESWRGLEPFKFESEGSCDLLLLNIANPWVRGLHQKLSSGENEELIKSVLSLIVGYFQSTNLLDTRNELVKELLDTIVGNWGIYSRKTNLDKIKIA